MVLSLLLLETKGCGGGGASLNCLSKLFHPFHLTVLDKEPELVWSGLPGSELH